MPVCKAIWPSTCLPATPADPADPAHSAAAPRRLLHLDVADCVRAELDGLLFELLFLGSVLDPFTGATFTYPPRTTALAVELAAGPLADRLCVSRPALRPGWVPANPPPLPHRL